MDISFHAKITGGKMAVILGTAVAITVFSACIAPLFHYPDDDDDNDFDKSKNGLARTTQSVQKHEASLMTIFLNGLRKIGIIPPPADPEKPLTPSCSEKLTKGTTPSVCVPPVVTVVDDSTTRKPLENPQGPLENPQGSVHNPLIPLSKDSESHNVMPCVNIHLILSKSTQSTQTEDQYLSAMETTETSEGSQMTESIRESSISEPRSSDMGTQTGTRITEDRSTLSAGKLLAAGTQAKLVMTEATSTLPIPRSSVQTGSLMTEDRATLLHAMLPIQGESLMTDELSQSSADQKLSVADQKVLVPRMSKPPRAHPPKKFIVGALIHRDDSLDTDTEVSSKSIINQLPSASYNRLEIRPTPTGRFRMQSGYPNQLSPSLASSSMGPPSATLYPRHFRGSNHSGNRRTGESEKTFSGASTSLDDRPRRTLKSLQSSNSRDGESDCEKCADTMGVQTQDHHSCHNRVHMAETSTPSIVIQDFERSIEPHSTSGVMSSTRIPNASIASIAEETASDAPESPSDMSHEADRNPEDEVIRRWNKNMNQLIRCQDIFLGRNRHQFPNDQVDVTNQSPKFPNTSPEILRGVDHPVSRTTISKEENNQSLSYKERRGITQRMRSFFLRRRRGKYGRTLPQCETRVEGTLRWNLTSP
ncbi:uncharacterized protein LOC135167167 isoform X2 [Diachasmimorpha longicaudata]|uniref:uncharacterized protein LOC135167167 isoform X2 n=1 Tax=Diachasmimorpha longicaudata TaxID=58733 RepID=UPI0030B8E123